MLEKRKVYNSKYKEIREELYLDREFCTDRTLSYNVENIENLPLQENELDRIKKEAEELSIKYWNKYFHILKSGDTYTISKYYEDNAILYYINGEEYSHEN
jgi:hypothetical protein